MAGSGGLTGWVLGLSGTRMVAGPCFSSCFGLPLQTTVVVIGVIELFITIIATVLNVAKFAQNIDTEGEECEGKDVCLGPLIKYSVFDAFFGALCALLLIVGGHTRSHCLLVTWILVTLFTSLKYVWVVVTHDWTSLEDWISITYLAFYTSVFVIIWSFMAEMSQARRQGQAYAQPYPAQGHVVINQTFQPAPPYHPNQCPTTPPGYPPHPPPYSQQPPSNPAY